jgi:hypothetical protein
MQQATRRPGYGFHRGIKSCLVGSGWLTVPTDFANILQGCGMDFFLAGWQICLAQLFDTPAHLSISLRIWREWLAPSGLTRSVIRKAMTILYILSVNMVEIECTQ